MRNLTLIVLGVAFIANSLLMIFAAESWYQLIPGVAETGPFNLHFVRDIGCAYLVCGAALLWLLYDARAWPAVLAAGAFQGLHALTHVWDALGGGVTLEHIASDSVAVILPALLVLWLGRSARKPG